jgi:hypothetical protein
MMSELRITPTWKLRNLPLQAIDFIEAASSWKLGIFIRNSLISLGWKLGNILLPLRGRSASRRMARAALSFGGAQ